MYQMGITHMSAFLVVYFDYMVTRSIWWKRTDITASEVGIMYQDGMTIVQIAKYFRCSARTAHLRLQESGVKSRPKGYPTMPSGAKNPRWTGGRSVSHDRWVEANPERRRMHYRANMAVAYAIRKGRLVRPNTCESCGNDNIKITAAHYDYNPENYLKVRWLCHHCHGKWDNSDPKTKYTFL